MVTRKGDTMIFRDINGNTRSRNSAYCAKLARGHGVRVDVDSTGLVMITLDAEAGGGQVCLRPWDNARLYGDAMSGALVEKGDA